MNGSALGIVGIDARLIPRDPWHIEIMPFTTYRATVGGWGGWANLQNLEGANPVLQGQLG